jgi:predicted DNA binding CopG/RHH family protein
MITRTTVRLPKELLSRAKKKAAAEGRTLSTLIEEGLQLALAQRRAPKHKPSLPRISTATGGPMLGLESANFSTLQEIEDLEYIERMKRF